MKEHNNKKERLEERKKERKTRDTTARYGSGKRQVSLSEALYF